ncbi:MAG: transporter substrate-binding protein [Rubritepida sp.]|nr:transporter substrate-binding protein [Rubritepida sp.]
MKRRDVLTAGAGLAAGLHAPGVNAQAARILKFRPNNDLSVVDPIWSSAFVTRHHGNAVFDTLYGMDNRLNPQPQMVEGHVVENDGLLWRLTLREGLRFHDGEPVRARDCVQSIRRWAVVDSYGQTLMAATDELSAPSDREIRFRLKRPFPLLPNALGKANTFMPAMMPERLALTDAGRQVSDPVGSGPFRFVAAERVAGARVVYERFAGYVPRPSGTPEFTSGPKVAHFGRVEWMILPDPGTAANALRAGEIDWYEDPLIDLLPTLRRDRRVVVDDFNPAGNMGLIRFNHLHAPFDRPAIRRAAMAALDQTSLMQAIAGADRAMWNDRVGVFVPESPMASDAGIAAPLSPDAARRGLEAAGYAGEKVTFISATSSVGINTLAEVATDQLRRAGMNVDFLAMDFGNWLQRRNRREPPDQGGWSVLTTFLPGLEMWDPAGHLALRGNGAAAWSGWPDSPRLEGLRDQWFATADAGARAAMGRGFQLANAEDVAFVPAGRWKQPTAYRAGLIDLPRHMPLFYTLRRQG